jgi:hypothetical protein
MVRFLLPYLIVALVVLVAGAALYANEATGVLGAYATGLAAILVAGVGYARWEERQHGPGARHR